MGSDGGRDSGAKSIMLTPRKQQAGRCKMKPTGSAGNGAEREEGEEKGKRALVAFWACVLEGASRHNFQTGRDTAAGRHEQR